VNSSPTLVHFLSLASHSAYVSLSVHVVMNALWGSSCRISHEVV